MAPPIVMVHGAFCGGWVFDDFKVPFQAAGHRVLTPDLRGHAPDAPPDAVVGVSMADYARDVAELCAGLEQPPVLLGHSLGGLVSQLASRRAPVRALVLLAPSPPWGVTGSSVEEAITAFGLSMLGSFWSGAVAPDRGMARAYSLDRLPPVARDAAASRLRPESGRALWETLNWWMDPFMTTSLGGPVEVPALALAGEFDVVHPPATVRLTAERIGAGFRIVPGMSHWLPGEPGAIALARSVLGWLETELTTAA